MPRLGVLGWPVGHSRSPAMHNAAFAELEMHDWRYQHLPVPPELFGETARALGTSGFLGANVTIPHKRVALEIADQASDAVREIGAANTLTFRDGAIAALNTDAPGLIAALEHTGCSVRGASAMVLGAGGSARAAIWALRHAAASEVSVWNRTSAGAKELAREFAVNAVRRPVSADLLVNCTSVGLERSATDSEVLNQLALTFDAVGKYSHVVDFVYNSSIETPLLRVARGCGARTLDGLEILLAQGALSFEHWTGRDAPLGAMRRALRSEP
ncbi:MAG TPA: shikimate dehydrogenase [Solirubrobacteraceae bacterium]|jgi:shikimate dehydrogenase